MQDFTHMYVRRAQRIDILEMEWKLNQLILNWLRR